MSDSQQLLTALATEHFTLQGARSHLSGRDDGAGVFEYMGIPPEGRRRPYWTRARRRFGRCSPRRATLTRPDSRCNEGVSVCFNVLRMKHRGTHLISDPSRFAAPRRAYFYFWRFT
jgi:hypothetical protein